MSDFKNTGHHPYQDKAHNQTYHPSSVTWTQIGLGVAAKNRELNELTLEVFPVESVAYYNGDLSDKWEEIESTGHDSLGEQYTSKIKTTVTLKATWKSDSTNSNRMTPPDVRRGEVVEIWRIGDSQDYYWTCSGGVREVNKRKLETAVFGYSAVKDEDVPLDLDNTYTQGVSTHEKIVVLANTTKHPSNKEKFTYQMAINTHEDKNILYIRDNQGNEITLWTEENLILLRNKKGVSIRLHEDNIISKGTWSHEGDLSVRQGDVYANNVSLSRHTHPETQVITEPPIPQSDRYRTIKLKKLKYGNPSKFNQEEVEYK